MTLTAENISCRFSDGSFGLKNVCLNLNKGEFAIIAGTNGSGKTLLCKHLTGLIDKPDGKVLINDKETSPLLLHETVGMVFQNPDNQMVYQTVEEDVSFGPEIKGFSDDKTKAAVESAMKKTGLTSLAKRSVHNLSGGEKHRVAIAGILTTAPDFIIFDEPFTNLDYPGVIQVLKQILELHKQGHGIILISHDLDKMLAHASRLILMKDGRIIAQGTPVEMAEHAHLVDLRPYRAENVKKMSWLYEPF